jgi:hypothetical protein
VAVALLKVYDEPSQTVAFGPAEAVALFTMVSVIELLAFPQGEFPIAVNVNVTAPEVISAALGV